MNKMLLTISVTAAALLVHQGLYLNSLASGYVQRQQQLQDTNLALTQEVMAKQKFPKQTPRRMSRAFADFVNQARVLEIFGGTRMQLENFSTPWEPTGFRQVQALPLKIHVFKFSEVTEMTEALNDIYMLEQRTDFMVTDVTDDHEALTVKGELYGV